jgi:hypothetical protein
METKPQTSREYFRLMLIIYFALVAGQVMFGLVVAFLRLAGDFSMELSEMKDIFLILSCVFAAGGYLGGRILFRKMMVSARDRASLAEKMANYRSAMIVRYALLEGATFFTIIACLITGDFLFLGFAGFLVLIFVTMPPTRNNAIRDLELSPAEEREILDPEAVIY